ncbi:MAG: hypothetical protein REI78_03360 [Pedobacter sp.]|nr:hypothetical protein [Pedobacter sp.]MDQ8052032.1 hypothetical protein [Pedobacter sp.]
MKQFIIIICLTLIELNSSAQSFNEKFGSLKKIEIDSGVMLTIDEPAQLLASNATKIIVFALPNGNTTAQTFGKKLKEGDDWHFNIQHIGAQTAFIRHADPKTNYIVVYLENTLKSWPAWRRKFADADERIAGFVELINQKYLRYAPKITICGHSGGGSFIFGYLNSKTEIPPVIERIGFLDATYGYETEKHSERLSQWLKHANNSLQIIAYNDSVVVYNGKPLVSPTGGTWYRSKLMAKELGFSFLLSHHESANQLWWADRRNQISIKLIKNPAGEIFHTVLVEKNGLIDLMFRGTKFQDRNYVFWGDRAYENYILE